MNSGFASFGTSARGLAQIIGTIVLVKVVLFDNIGSYHFMLKQIKYLQKPISNSSFDIEFILIYEDPDLDSELEKELMDNLALFQVQIMMKHVKFKIKTPTIELHIPLSDHNEDPMMEMDSDRLFAEWDWEFKQFYNNIKEDLKS
jgi:hypothetical protein